ncbi:hypothetical protein [Comamonas sp. JC664]|uniref:hypothetical protein n=1 Tax=Comamonas sp. JC664 TaxID=2801917 RepID=UPI00360E3F3B
MPHAFLRRSIGALFFTLLALVLSGTALHAQAQIKLQIGSGASAPAMDTASGPRRAAW